MTAASRSELFPRHLGGDREFAGNGPIVKVEAELTRYISNPNQLTMKLWFDALETRPDRSHGWDFWEFPVYVSPPGWAIDAILSDNSDVWSFEDSDHSYDTMVSNGSGFVKSLVVRGDTDGADLGNTTEDDTHLHTISFNPVRIRLKKIS